LKVLASVVIRGRMLAAAVAVTLASLALIFTPLVVLSSAAIGLVTLRQGASEGLVVSGIAIAAMAAMGALLFGQPVALALVGVGLWAPALALGHVLRVWRSLPLMVEAALVAGFGLVLLQHLVMGDPAAFWAEQMRVFWEQMPQPQGFDEGQVEQMVVLVAPWMVGGFAAVWTLQMVVSMFVARAWQAQLFNPGGFGEEFRGLRLGRWLLYLAPVLLVGGMLSGGPGIVAQLSLVAMGGFFLQGVALVHGLIAALQAGVGWLLGFYMLLLIALPHSFTVVSAVGFADGWLNFRAKVRRATKRDGGDD